MSGRGSTKRCGPALVPTAPERDETGFGVRPVRSAEAFDETSDAEEEARRSVRSCSGDRFMWILRHLVWGLAFWSQIECRKTHAVPFHCQPLPFPFQPSVLLDPHHQPDQG